MALRHCDWRLVAMRAPHVFQESREKALSHAFAVQSDDVDVCIKHLPLLSSPVRYKNIAYVIWGSQTHKTLQNCPNFASI
jgi:hypothetical protein